MLNCLRLLNIPGKAVFFGLFFFFFLLFFFFLYSMFAVSPAPRHARTPLDANTLVCARLTPTPHPSVCARCSAAVHESPCPTSLGTTYAVAPHVSVWHIPDFCFCDRSRPSSRQVVPLTWRRRKTTYAPVFCFRCPSPPPPPFPLRRWLLHPFTSLRSSAVL